MHEQNTHYEHSKSSTTGPNANGITSPLPNGRSIKLGSGEDIVVQDWGIDNMLRWACCIAEPAKELASVRRLVTVLIAQRRMVRRTALEVFGPPASLERASEQPILIRRRRLPGLPALSDDRSTRRLVQGDSPQALQAVGA